MPVKAMAMPYLSQVAMTLSSRTLPPAWAMYCTIVAHAASGLGDVLHAALVCPLDVVAEGEEGVRAQRHALQRVQPRALLLAAQDVGLLREELLPHAVGQHVVVVVADVDIYGIVAVGTADFLHPRQVQYLRVLAQVPDVGLIACQTGAVDAALLSGADADGLPVLDVADGIGLRVLQRDECNHQVAPRLGGEVLVLRGDVGEEVVAVQLDFVAPLLEGDAEDVFVLNGRGLVCRVYLDDVVRALALALQYLQGFRGVARGNDAVGHFAVDEGGRLRIAHVAQGNEVSFAMSVCSTDYPAKVAISFGLRNSYRRLAIVLSSACDSTIDDAR